jgi:O-antigen/teichoic acid export membrane protein
VTVYEIANKIQSAAQLVQSVAASALIPAAAFARAQRAVLQDMFLRGSAYSLAVSLPFVATVLIFAEPLIVTWIDPKYADAASVARWFALYLGLAGFLIVGATMIVALGRLRFLIVVNFVVIAVNLALSIALVGPLGIDGVVIGSVVAYAASWPLQLGYVLRELGIPVAQWLRRVVAPQLPGIVVQAAVSLPLLRVAESAGSVVVVGLLALVPIAASLAVFVALGLRGADRAALFTTLRSALGRHAPAPAERPPA